MNMVDIAARLQARFGLGDRPAIRMRLYRRLEREVELHGAPVYEQIAAAAADSDTADNPGHYFARTVTIRLRDRHFLQQGGEL